MELLTNGFIYFFHSYSFYWRRGTFCMHFNTIKDPLSGMRQFQATETT